MKYASSINALVFVLIASITGYAILNLAISTQRDTEQVASRLQKLRQEQAEFIRDVFAFANSRSVSQDHLSKSLEQVRSTTRRLEELLETKHELNPSYLAPCTRVIANTRAVTDRAEHIRSQLTVLRNAISQIQMRLAERELTPIPQTELRQTLWLARQTIPTTASPDHAEVYALLAKASNSISEHLAELDTELASKLRIVRAQMDKVVATARFLESDFEKLDTLLSSTELQQANVIVSDQARENAILQQQMLQFLSIASVALIAFVGAGIWQFRSQAIELAQLNAGLESRVQQRTKQLAASQDFLARTLDSLPSHICILNTSGEIIQTNALWNLQPLADETVYRGIGTSYYDLCEAETGTASASMKELAKSIKRIIESGAGAFSVEYPRVLDGQDRWFQVSATPLAGESSGSVVVSHTCVTERVRAEQALQQQNEEAERLALVAKYTDNAVVITDSRARIEWVNEGFTRITGYTFDEVQGRVPGALLHGEETCTETKDYIRSRLAEQKGFDVEIVNYSKSGRKYWLAIEVRPICDAQGNVVRYIAIESEITSRKEAEAELSRLLEETQNQKALLDTVISSVNDGIIAADEQGRFLCFNRAAERILDRKASAGTCPEDWETEYSLYEVDGTTPVAAADFPLNRAIQGESLCNRELVIRRDEGDITISANATPLRSSAYRGGVITLRDVTNHKQLEQKLSQAQKLESIGQLAAGIAHEINTPMQFVGDNLEFLNDCAEKLFAVVDRYSQLLLGDEPISWQDRRDEICEISEKYRFEYMRTQFPEAIEECLEGIHRTVKIVKAMKDFSHPGNKEKTPVNINEAIESTVAISRNRWKYASEMQLELDPNLPEIPVYAAEINQVLLNIVVNAADAIADHFGEDDFGLITIRTFQHADAIQIDIEDNGCGIPEAIKAKVFDPFFTTKDVGKGTGQGLSITNDVVVNMHQGAINVQSEVGKGTVFSIRLPIDPQPLELPDPQSETAAPSAHMLNA